MAIGTVTPRKTGATAVLSRLGHPLGRHPVSQRAGHGSGSRQADRGDAVGAVPDLGGGGEQRLTDRCPALLALAEAAG